MDQPTRSATFITFKASENISIRPGQYILLQCENLSTLEWHPFTITDYAMEPSRTIFTIAVAVRGDWTSELYEKIAELKLHMERSKRRKSKSRRRKAPRKLNFIMDGPFPSSMEAIMDCHRAVLIGFGISVTSFIAVFNYIL